MPFAAGILRPQNILNPDRAFDAAALPQYCRPIKAARVSRRLS
jgi:hypothetical protein